MKDQMGNEKDISSFASKFLSAAGLGSFGLPGLFLSLTIPGSLSLLIPTEYRLIILVGIFVFLLLLTIKFLMSRSIELNRENILGDKIISYISVLILCPFTEDWFWMIISVGVFLVFNQMKLFPYMKISRKSGLAGVIGDDAVTGVYSVLTMHLFYSAFQVIGLIKFLGMKY